MSEQARTFCQTTDLYLQMLREAQRVEDKKLIQLIRCRLKHVAHPPIQTSTGCEIISFPRHVYVAVPSTIKDLPFWPRFGFGQAAVLAAALFLITYHSYLT